MGQTVKRAFTRIRNQGDQRNAIPRNIDAIRSNDACGGFFQVLPLIAVA